MKRKLSIALAMSFLFGVTPLASLASAADSGNMTELQSGWRMMSAKNVTEDGATVSQPAFNASKWYVIQELPSTVLQTLQDNGVYQDLYYGMNLATAVPQDLWKQDWWYRTTFAAPAGRDVYALIFKGINY